MTRVVECVPNFSEGRDKAVIEKIAAAISSSPGCRLLDVDPGESTNRTVYTFVGDPSSVVSGALAAARVAFHLIDMTKQKGAHPRMGALDVCPFIPVSNVTMDDCVDCANSFGAQLAEALNVPVFRYAAASSNPARKTLPQVRQGEYEGIADKILRPEWKPDFGPAEFVPRWGMTATGARKFLVAYNINLLCTKEQAHRIALNIRENGRGDGKPGRLSGVQGIGWWLDEHNLAQVSTNIMDFEETPVHRVFEECVADAKELALPVVGSEIVGLVPLNAILTAAQYYMEKENLFIVDERQKVMLAIQRMGLSSINVFKPEEKIIEYMTGSNDASDPLSRLTVSEFVKTVGSRTTTPGGGSCAALVGSLGAALAAMACWMTYGNRKFEALDSEMRQLLPELDRTMRELLPDIDRDTDAFNSFVASTKLPTGTEVEKAAKSAAVAKASQDTIDAPLSVIRKCVAIWPLVLKAAGCININAISDLQVGVQCVQLGVQGAWYNVRINCANDPTKAEFLREATELLEQSTRESAKVVDIIEKRITAGN